MNKCVTICLLRILLLFIHICFSFPLVHLLRIEHNENFIVNWYAIFLQIYDLRYCTYIYCEDVRAVYYAAIFFFRYFSLERFVITPSIKLYKSCNTDRIIIGIHLILFITRSKISHRHIYQIYIYSFLFF